MIEKIRECFKREQVLYTRHARDEMAEEEFGEIRAIEVTAAVMNGKIIESYPDDKPYPSYLIYGMTPEQRPLHLVCSYAEDSDLLIIITVYHPDPTRWIQFERRLQ